VDGQEKTVKCTRFRNLWEVAEYVSEGLYIAVPFGSNVLYAGMCRKEQRDGSRG